MESRLVKRNGQRLRRGFRVGNKARGTAQRPRMSVSKTNKHLSVQLINDEAGVTLCSASTLTKEMSALSLGGKSKEAAKKLGTLIAEGAKKHNVTTVVFDRGSNKYHGLLAELADSARAAGLEF